MQCCVLYKYLLWKHKLNNIETKTTSLISVVIPIHKSLSKVEKLRRHINYATTRIEVIYVVDKKFEDLIGKKEPYEKIIYINNIGRGYTLAEGARWTEGEVIIFLHSDTYFPRGWDVAIRNALKNDDIIGGGFSLEFDYKNTFLSILIFVVTSVQHLLQIFSGDRAIFVRANLLKPFLSILEVPIMEDVELSRWMRKKGKIVILREKVTTSADTFRQYGMLRNTYRIAKCLLMYTFGKDLQKIYNFYYSK
jgi:glycosyltransferase involved in cell wall biosynthesis